MLGNSDTENVISATVIYTNNTSNIVIVNILLHTLISGILPENSLTLRTRSCSVGQIVVLWEIAFKSSPAGSTCVDSLLCKQHYLRL